ncbi:(2Fe-2S)-binding protein [Halarcobacter mediterraneus]|uniref:(2Fe-2S)-binding protein n=1 Tax=Halarcobacter mediterraneus TaxID=2023153 RepID=A0A4Q1B080_9BACT|nr:(2Fe-2S)-binding protein [Halarcobacter mediterraneus]RXK14402.1 (2Fe-2S)-binding protein [Halarcobacter mediterraneus]
MLKEINLDYEVCNCVKVTIEDIIKSVKEKEIKSLRELQEITKAGTECRHCIFPEGDFGKIKKKIYCKTILNEVLNG